MNAAYRQLTILQLLLSDHLVIKTALADQFEVSPRAVQRDISQVKNFIADQQLPYQLVYRRKLGGYQLVSAQGNVSKQVVLVLVKILLASRAVTTTELHQTITGLMNLLPQPERREIQPIIKNETFYYQPVHHGKPLLKLIWELSQLIIHQTTIDIDYRNAHDQIETRTILPQAVIFSEYYFYVVAYSAKYHANRFFRIDRIFDYHRAHQPLTRNRAQRVEDGELRHVIHYMQPGEKMTIRFEFSGIVEAALDRFPTAKVLKKFPDGRVLIETEAFDRGAKMWLLSQGPLVKVVAPASFVKDVQASLQATLAQY
ncbi:WYL domain-containing protein [Lactiplantibacillus garii]|uniref:WYL domain-containing protein n=1 Tax=Lactiplantibacillus garii TaxID=2306423 RepID=A0A426D4P6_9LACO|nr:WYL domain-containing transcriptional regulator [Lactiplantibacillus garii]RRK09586.1 WYL domain-containing protein [Lactiplantibacillus garii]